jgi:FkbM family methyltransferase
VKALGELVLVPLRAARAGLARLIAAAVERYTSLEPVFVRVGRTMARRSRSGGGLYWLAQDALIQRLRRSGHRYREVTIRNQRFYVDITDPTGRFSFFYSTPYEKAVVDAVITALKPGDVFLDVGAHLGYFSAVAARRVGPAGRVIAFEPHEGLHDDLRGMAGRNEVEGIIEIVPLAVAEREADFTLYTSDTMPAHSTLEPERSPIRGAAAFRPTTVVHATSLDAWLTSRPELASRVRCIKIDVQGAESRVLAGMARTLLPTGVTILCETTIGTDADVMLERAGFRRHRIERGTSPHGNFLYVRPSPPPL